MRLFFSVDEGTTKHRVMLAGNCKNCFKVCNYYLGKNTCAKFRLDKLHFKFFLLSTISWLV